MVTKKFRIIIPILFLIVAMLACESSGQVSVKDNGGTLITSTEEGVETSQENTVDTPTPKFTTTPRISPTPPPLGYATIIVDMCNIRSGPGTSYSVSGTGQKNDVVDVFGRSADNYWLLIDRSQSIWISTSVVEINLDLISIPIVDPVSLFTSIPETKLELSEPTQTLPTVESVVAALTCDKIYERNKNLTEIQWKDYVNSILGKPIEYTGSVREVSANGSIEIGACKGMFDKVTFTLYGIPKDVGLGLPKYQDIKGEGTINQVYRKNVIYKGLLGTRIEEWLYINVYGTLEVID